MRLAKEYPNDFLSPFQSEMSSKDHDRRRDRRRPLNVSVFCQKVGSQDGRLLSGSTVNVSPGGALVKMQGSTLRDGELVSVEMAVPSSDSLLDQRGRFSSYARVVRVDGALRSADSREQIALEFCESSRFSF